MNFEDDQINFKKSVKTEVKEINTNPQLEGEKDNANLTENYNISSDEIDEILNKTGEIN